VFPAGTLRTVILHWTAGNYATVFSAYHFCLIGASDVSVAATHDLRANMRDVGSGTGAYAAHAQGRNSYAAGIAICCMDSATPHDFAAYPLTPAQIEALCVVTAHVGRHYGVAVGDIRTHAEAALEDGYFGAGGDNVRWDIARLEPAAGPLRPAEAAAVGDRLRARIAELY
jgi:hypothetical protein